MAKPIFLLRCHGQIILLLISTMYHKTERSGTGGTIILTILSHHVGSGGVKQELF